MPTSEHDRSILDHIVLYCCDIEGMRNVIAHAHGGLSVQTTCETIEPDISALRYCMKTDIENHCGLCH